MLPKTSSRAAHPARTQRLFITLDFAAEERLVALLAST
jgi:hypothetical protein